MARTTIAALVLGLAASTLAAQQAPPAGADFWIGMGRFTAAGGEVPKDPIDLGGDYAGSGTVTGDTTRWTSSVSMKRVKTVETPQGAKINLYELKYAGVKDVQGIAMHVGRRLYVAWGSKHIALAVGAPVVLTPGEASAWQRSMGLQKQADTKNAGPGDAWYTVKGSPWFAGVRQGKEDRFSFAATSDWDGAGFYAFWMEFDALWGQQFYRDLKRWGPGEYKMFGFILKEGNEACAGKHCWYSGKMTVKANGETWDLNEVSGIGDKRDIDGSAFELPDGTVVWVMGGGESAGAGWYDVADGRLAGRFWTWTGGALGTHQLVPSADVLAKNAAFFAGR